jgi:hypothetical protein
MNWICKACETSNTTEHTVCEVCERSKYDPRPVSKSAETITREKDLGSLKKDFEKTFGTVLGAHPTLKTEPIKRAEKKPVTAVPAAPVTPTFSTEGKPSTLPGDTSKSWSKYLAIALIIIVIMYALYPKRKKEEALYGRVTAPPVPTVQHTPTTRPQRAADAAVDAAKDAARVPMNKAVDAAKDAASKVLDAAKTPFDVSKDVASTAANNAVDEAKDAVVKNLSCGDDRFTVNAETLTVWSRPGGNTNQVTILRRGVSVCIQRSTKKTLDLGGADESVWIVVRTENQSLGWVDLCLLKPKDSEDGLSCE